MLPTLKTLAQKKTKTKKRLPKLKGLGRQEKLPAPPDLDEGPQRLQNVVDDELQRLTNALDDERLAKRVLKLKKKYPDGTIPELVVMDWLERKRLQWGFQVWVLGGRAIRGGQVLDFVVVTGTGVIVLEVQGNYWHTRPGKKQVDAIQRMGLLAITIWGRKVKGVVEVWESRLMDKRKREATMNRALQGIGMGP